VNTGASWPEPETARLWVRRMQRKLHQWAVDDPGRQFDDLFNLVCDPAFLLIAWSRVRSNRGARSAGVDGLTATGVDVRYGMEEFLAVLRADLKTGAFRPMPVRERMIPKAGGKLRRLGIPTVRDRVVQAALKLVLEPIFEADFQPGSFGYRPKKTAHQAVQRVAKAIVQCKTHIIDLDLKAYFDTVRHHLLLEKVARRQGEGEEGRTVHSQTCTKGRIDYDHDQPMRGGPGRLSFLCPRKIGRGNTRCFPPAPSFARLRPSLAGCAAGVKFLLLHLPQVCHS